MRGVREEKNIKINWKSKEKKGTLKKEHKGNEFNEVENPWMTKKKERERETDSSKQTNEKCV